MNESVDDDIVVLASEQSDRQLMNELLLEAGLRNEIADPVGADSAPRAGGAVPSGRASGTGPAGASALRGWARATIVCHRTSRSAPRPEVPAVTDGGRVVVFSDCTAERAVVEALEAGAHHYFDIAEPRPLLQARLHAALRSYAQDLRRGLRVAPFRFDLSKRRVWRDEKPIGLSPKEFDLAYYLFSNRGRTVDNSELMTAVWSLPRSMDTRRIDTAACRIRKKMRLEAPDGHWRLRRLRGKGYLLVPAADELS